MVLKQRGKIIRSTTKRKNFFVLDTEIGKARLIKERGKLIYLLSKNLQIRLWYRQLGHTLNARVIQALKLTDNIDISINEGQKEGYHFFSDSKNDNKVEKLESGPTSNDNYLLTSISTLVNQVIDPNNIIK